ncbi:hypothetical protein A2Z33_07320 [Candidatus Gottesmanbacteria bacterium RBG_16_52_11]|uniref:GH18 domain-containing protein n=1 Tax=Candidatus Gottesmanbacteria bacterium RBG_16_52_11 TaxID=1798374 RepID=A0A1F5YYT7_9BACT|nr:MAG: hypothetical protein A2Z33_07320 [Candidatus Gottesmanbacteria bacterium RBG_16_52_11]
MKNRLYFGIACTVTIVLTLSLVRLYPGIVRNRIISPLGSLTDPLTQQMKLKYYAWAPWWNPEDVTASMEKAAGRLSAVHPVWYKVNGDGKIEEIPARNGGEIRQMASASGIPVMPMISNEFDPERVSRILSSADLKSELAVRMVEIARNNGFAGWDIDWEQIAEKDRDAFTEFISYLKPVFNGTGLSLSVSVHARTGTADEWKLAKGHDYRGLSIYADQVRVMAYDFHNATSVPGPVTPKNRLEQAIRYAKANIPRDKLVLGLPFYGYDWDSRRGEPLSRKQLLERIEKNTGTWEYDAEALAVRGTYTVKGVKHIIWFENTASVTEKIRIAEKEGIFMFAFWCLGGEDPLIWESLE